MNYELHLLVYFAIYVIVALSLNIVVGYCGLITLSHASYFAIGAYACSLAMLKLHWAFFPATLLGVSISAVLSLALSIPSWRFKGDQFVLVSLVVQVVILSLLNNWTNPRFEFGTLQNLTNGSFGIVGIPRPSLFGTTLDTIPSMAILAVTLMLGCGLLAFLLKASPWGRLLKCIRDDELAARGLGKNVRMAKVQALAIACGMAAVAGALYATYVGYIDPSAAGIDQSILMLCYVIVGGVGNFRGPIVGVFVLLAIPEALRFAHVPDASAANLQLIAYGALLITLMHVRPQGLAGEYRIR
ncbi:MAG TPA: branched-chain amino acid ABC transporter permease [Capsulimonadaceae bacterium]|jgi:branched-chain amino acid transport system permease protein